jgi:hypothetical protein
VLRVIASGLIGMGFEVEQGKTKMDKLPRPVFFGDEGTFLRTYGIDAFEPERGIALEVEAGRATAGNAVYRDLIQASLMLDAKFLALAVPVEYRYGTNRTRAELREDVLGRRGDLWQSPALTPVRGAVARRVLVRESPSARSDRELDAANEHRHDRPVRREEYDLDALDVLGRRDEVAGLDRCWRGHVAEIVERTDVPKVEADTDVEFHGGAI